MRCIGTDCTTASSRPARPPLAWISVSMAPGRTTLTRMPSVPTSRARPFVRLSIAALLAL
jgi:hypothetical protein